MKMNKLANLDRMLTEMYWNSLTSGEKAAIVIKIIFKILVRVSLFVLIVLALSKFIFGW